MYQQTTTAYGAPPMMPQQPMMAPAPMMAPGPMMTGGMPAPMPGAMMTGGMPVRTTTFTPFITSLFGRTVQLIDERGKFLCGGDHHAHAHHNPNHSYHQSSYWFIEKHDAFGDRVRLRNTNGKYLCHDGRSSFCSMHHHGSRNDVAWHMEQFPGFGETFVCFRSHGGHFLGCDKHGHDVHCMSNGGPHSNQRFEIRFV